MEVDFVHKGQDFVHKGQDFVHKGQDFYTYDSKNVPNEQQIRHMTLMGSEPKEI